MNRIINLLVWNILGWWLLDLCVFDSIKVTGDFKINQLHMSVNLAHLLPHTGGILFVVGTRGILNGGRRLRERNLLRIP